ncbi:hypothetical protein [Saccharopolyspora thermophila]|uniref:hypothetical protein n=1 Tax=Saccharopolyspora thermophila TaxID=89367 RepID=UPI00166D11DA|nr:hypothetical protein [Saccharopolyspora subtropica]
MSVPDVCDGNLFLTWWGGQEVKECALLGWKVVFWARTGKWLQFFAGLIAILDVIGPERLLQIGENSSQRVERARKIIELLKVQARVKEYELNIREAVADDPSLSTKRNPFSEFGPLKGNHEFHDKPDYRCLFESVRNYFDGKSMCDKCTVTISGDSESSSHRGPKPIWECKHGKDWFDRTINDYIEAHSNNEELEARRYAERRAEIDGFAKVVKVFPILLILLASPVMKWMEKTFSLHVFVIFVVVGFILCGSWIHRVAAIWLLCGTAVRAQLFVIFLVASVQYCCKPGRRAASHNFGPLDEPVSARSSAA